MANRPTKPGAATAERQQIFNKKTAVGLPVKTEISSLVYRLSTARLTGIIISMSKVEVAIGSISPSNEMCHRGVSG